MRPDVALISPYPRLGVRHGGASGVASYSANLAHALADAGLAVTVVAPYEDGEPDRGTDEREHPVEVLRAFATGAAAVPHALTAARATGAPVVHLQHELFLYGGAASVAGLFGGLRGRSGPTVVTMHQVVDPHEITSEYTRMHRIAVAPVAARAGLALLQRGLPRLVDATIVHEPAFARLVARARVIPHGVEELSRPDAVSRRAAREQLGLPLGRTVVLCFGFVAPYKGLESALGAAALAGPEILLVVAGGEHPRLVAQGDDYLGQLRSRFGDIARFTGYVPDSDVGAWFHAADVALFPYPAPHAASGALALALAHRTPVLLSPQLAAVTGADTRLVCSLEPPELAARLRAIGRDGAMRAELRDATAAMTDARAWPQAAAQHRSVYQEVARATGTSRRRLRAA